MSTKSDTVLCEIDDSGKIATLWLNRVDKRNALNFELFNCLGEQLDELNQNSDIRVIFIKAKGPHFCSGIDLNLLSGQDPTAPPIILKGPQFRYIVPSVLQPFFTKLTIIEKPIIAVIDGICFGSGFELALACDFRFATEKALFSMPESRLGIIPDLGGTTRLCKLVNVSHAKEIILAAKKVNAVDGYRMGFINETATNMEDLMKKADNLAEELMKSGPLPVGMGKRLIDKIYGQPDPVGLLEEVETQAVLFNSKDFNRAVAAWFDKTTPKWKGK
jgi:enoyl-CoA hydratase/carnithine racemase